MPVVAGVAHTKNQILVYSIVLVLVSILPCAAGFADSAYGMLAGILGVRFVVLAVRLRRSTIFDSTVARDLFKYSIFYLAVLFSGLLVEALA